MKQIQSQVALASKMWSFYEQVQKKSTVALSCFPKARHFLLPSTA